MKRDAASLAAAPAAPVGLFSRRRLARVASFSSVQVLVQGVGFVAGLILVRALAQAEYGHYTLMIAMVGLGAVLFDLGLATGVLSQGGPHHGEPAAQAALLGDAFRLQRQLTLALALPLVAVFAYMLREHGIDRAKGLTLLGLALLASWLTARNALWLAVARLRGDLALQQRVELGVNLGRALAIAGAALVYVDATLAAGVVLLAAAASNVLLSRHYVRLLGNPADAASGRWRGALFGFVRRQAPNSLYYCINGQVAVWLVGLFGTAERVAEVGALGRLALLFTMVGALVAAFVQPYFARPRRAAELLQAFVTVNLLFAAALAALTLGASLAPQAMLWVLGPKYASLGAEAVWMVASSVLAAWSGAVYAMGAARGWLVPGVGVIPVGLASLALGAVLLDCSTVLGAFQLNTLSAGVTAVLVLAYVGASLRRYLRGAEPAVAS